MEKNYRRVLAVLIAFTLMAGIMACVGLQVKDPVKAGLYAIKQEWLSVREYVIKEYLDGRMSDQQVQDFRKKDNQFTQVYNLTLMLQNIGTDNQVLLESNLNQLRSFLLEARRKYYPTQ